MEITVKLAGTKPLVLGSIEAADPRTEHYQVMQEMRGTTSKNRTPAWYDKMERLQFLAAFYTIPEIPGVAIPQGNVRQSLIEAARSKRLGPKATGAIAVALDPAAPLMYQPGWENHWSPEELFKHKEFVWTRMLRAKTGAGLATYPRFSSWALTVQFDLDETVLSVDQFWDLADLAGRITGIGACRKLGYGRFAVAASKKNGAAS